MDKIAGTKFHFGIFVLIDVSGLRFYSYSMITRGQLVKKILDWAKARDIPVENMSKLTLDQLTLLWIKLQMSE